MTSAVGGSPLLELVSGPRGRLRYHEHNTHKVTKISGVKLFFCRFKKKEIFFVFHHEQKKVKLDFVVIAKSPLFLAETLRICSITSWFYFFLSVRNGGRKFYACLWNKF